MAKGRLVEAKTGFLSLYLSARILLDSRASSRLHAWSNNANERVSWIAQLSKWRVPRVPFFLPFLSVRISPRERKHPPTMRAPSSSLHPRATKLISFESEFVAETGRNNLINGTTTLSLSSFAVFHLSSAPIKEDPWPGARCTFRVSRSIEGEGS